MKWFVWYVASIGPQGSVAIADVPVSPLSIVGRFQTLTDTVPTLRFCPKGGNIGSHHLLANVILGSGVVHVEAAVLGGLHWFVVFHVASIETQEKVAPSLAQFANRP